MEQRKVHIDFDQGMIKYYELIKTSCPLFATLARLVLVWFRGATASSNMSRLLDAVHNAWIIRLPACLLSYPEYPIVLSVLFD